MNYHSHKNTAKILQFRRPEEPKIIVLRRLLRRFFPVAARTNSFLTPDIVKKWVQQEPYGLNGVAACLGVLSTRVMEFQAGQRTPSISHSLLYQLRRKHPQLFDSPPLPDEYIKFCWANGLTWVGECAQLIGTKTAHIDGTRMIFMYNAMAMRNVMKVVLAVDKSERETRMSEVRSISQNVELSTDLLNKYIEKWSPGYVLQTVGIYPKTLYEYKRRNAVHRPVAVSLALMDAYPTVFTPISTHLFLKTLKQYGIKKELQVEYMLGKTQGVLKQYKNKSALSTTLSVLFQLMSTYLERYGVDPYYEDILSPVRTGMGLDDHLTNWPRGVGRPR